MWEKVKTIFLVGLIISSLAMSYRLWFGMPNYEAITLPSYERVPRSDISSAVNLLLPERIVFFPEQLSSPPLEEPHPGEEPGDPEDAQEEIVNPEEAEPPTGMQEHDEEELVEQEPPEGTTGEEGTEEEKEAGNAALHDEVVYIFAPSQQGFIQIWENFTRQLNRVDNVSLAPADPEMLQARKQERKEPYMEITFTAPFDVELFYPSWGTFMEIQEFPLIQNIYLFWGEEPLAFFQSTQGDLFQVSWNASFSSIFNLLKELPPAHKPDYILLSSYAEGQPLYQDNNLLLEQVFVPKQVPALSDFRFSRDSVKEEELAAAFFVDLSLVRQIKERDEAIIFTDGKKGLRISSQGMIEFSAPLQRDPGKNLSYREALDIGADYVSMYVDLPEKIQLRIAELTPVLLNNKEYYQMKLWGYHDGLILNPDAFTVELIYDRQGLVSFNCLCYRIHPKEKKPLEVDLLKAVSELYSELPGLFQQEDPRQITGVQLMYAPADGYPEEVLQPFWNIELDRKVRVMVDARNGEVFSVHD